MSWRTRVVRFIRKAFGEEAFLSAVFGSTRLGLPPKTGTRQLIHAYNTMPWLRAVVNKISWDVGTNRWKLYVRTNKGSKALKDEITASATNADRRGLIKAGLKSGDMREVDNNRFLDFMRSGPPTFSTTPIYFNGLTGLQLTQIYLDLVGEAAWILERNGLRTPTNFAPMPPHWVEQIPNPNYPQFRFVSPYSVTEVDPENVAWFYHPDPSNPYGRGSGTGRSLADELETDENLAKYLRTFFENDARPPYLITVDGVDKSELIRLESKWLAKHTGRDRWWKPDFLNKKVDVHEFGNSLSDNGVPELRVAQRDIFIQVYGMPPEMIGINENSNRSTIDVGEYIYAAYVRVPRLEFLRSCLQQRVIPEFDERLILEFENPVQQDKEFAQKAIQAQPYIARVREVRDLVGLPDDLPGNQGDLFPVPLNVDFQDSLEPAPKPEPVSAPGGQGDAGDEGESNQPGGKAYLTKRSAKRVNQAAKAVDSVSVSKTTTAAIKETVTTFAEGVISDVGVDTTFSLRDPVVSDFLRSWAGDRIQDLVDDTTKGQLRETLAAGVDAGETEDELEGRIQHVFDVSDSRAASIAKTETNRASNFGTWRGMKQAGVGSKEWLSTQDDNVRDAHVDLDGQVVGIDENFTIDGAEAQYPGDFGVAELDINCRCGTLPVMAGQESLKDSRRVLRWKSLDRERVPHARKLEALLRKRFALQHTAVLHAWREGKASTATVVRQMHIVGAA